MPMCSKCNQYFDTVAAHSAHECPPPKQPTQQEAAIQIAKIVCLTRYGLQWEHAENTSKVELTYEALHFLQNPTI